MDWLLVEIPLKKILPDFSRLLEFNNDEESITLLVSMASKKKPLTQNGWDAIQGLWKDRDIDAVAYQKEVRRMSDAGEDSALLALVVERGQQEGKSVLHDDAWGS